MYDHSFYPFI
jgi:hypothetical protein